MTNATLGARSESNLSPEQKTSLRYAMLSVYFRTVGSQLETRGAPVIAVPPDVQPLSLDDALDRLAVIGRLTGSEDRLWDAYWRIVRAVPVEGWEDWPLERRYPRAFVDRLGSEGVKTLDELRRTTRTNAHLLSAALTACADGRWDESELLAQLLEERAGGEAQALTDTAASLQGRPAHAFIRWLGSSEEHRENAQIELNKLQAEVGINLNDFVEDFLDTVAFAHFKESRKPQAPETILTSSCIVRQDTNTLTTTATVTTLVKTDFDVLKRVIDPLGWPVCSDVILHTGYLADPFGLGSEITERPPLGTPFEDTQYLFENVAVRWGFDEVQTGEFNNVLAIDKFSVDPKRRTITLPFRLYRSIDSSILWDQRAGGILIDGGYIVARPVGEPDDGRWRVTSRKVLKFSDRTPYSNAPGWLDFGQMLNYLAPASVTWWLETELGSADCALYREDDAGVTEAAQEKGEADGR
jgi:hypothetical protein